MENERRKIIVIGLDGATFQVMDPMIADGRLPNLKRMITNGSRGILRSVVPPYSPPAWISMLTGKNPGRHGIFHFLRRKPHSYDLEVNSYSNVTESTLFSILAGRGIASGAMNIPMTYPPRKDVSGFFISGIPVPPDSHSYARPAEIQELIDSRGYRVDYDFRGLEPNIEMEGDRWEDYGRLLDGLVEISRKRIDIFLELMKREELPLLFVVISLTDRIQHYFWKFMDREHPGYTEEGNQRFGDAVQRAYEVSDELLGRIVEQGGEDVDYLVVSDHGAGPHCGDFHLNLWLRDNDYISLKGVPRWVPKRAPLRHILSRLGVGFTSYLLPEYLRSRPVPYLGRKRFIDGTDIIWSGTKAFASMYGIRVNLRGREPCGIVEPGREYVELIGEVKDRLRSVVNPINGGKLLTNCLTKEEAFSGDHIDGSPDLFLELAGISFLPTEEWNATEWCVPRLRCPSSGTHRIEGVFIGKGPGIAEGHDIGELRIEDIMPTILYLLDIPVPRDLDGEVVLSSMADRRPVSYQDDIPGTSTGGERQGGYTEEEEDQITDNLRGMGYL